MVGDVHAPQCNKAYTTIQLPASASRKGTASLHVKVNTRARGNVLPLHVFCCLYPDQISPAGLPTGLDHISTRLTPYNGYHIPLYGALPGPINWQPDCPGTQPHKVNLYWYIADTPGPAILGLPSSEETGSHEDELCHHSQVTWHTSCICSHYSGHNQACYSPWSNQVHQIHWWLDKGVPRLVQGHWQIPWWIQDLTPSWCTSCDTCPQEMPHCLTSKGQGAPWQDGMPRHDHLCRWTNGLGILHYLHPEGKWWATSVPGSLWPQWGHLPWSSQDTHHGRKLLMSLHTLASSLSWMLTMDTGPSSSTRTPACLWLSTVLSEDTVSCNFPLAWSVPTTSSRKKWIRSLKNAKDVSELQTTSPYMAILRQNMMPTYEILCISPANMTGVQPTKDTHEGPSCQFLWLPLWCQWCPPRPRKSQCCTCLTGTHKCHQTSRVLRSSHIPKSLHPWSVHLDHLSLRSAQEGHRLHMEPHLQHCFWVDQGSCHQWHHPQILQPLTSTDNTGQCLTGRPWCSTPAKWQTHSLCQQGPQQNWMSICKHRERDASCCLQSREIPHLHLWTVLHDWIRPQATWIHLPEEPSRHSCMATMHDVMPTGIQLHNPLLPR